MSPSRFRGGRRPGGTAGKGLSKPIFSGGIGPFRGAGTRSADSPTMACKGYTHVSSGPAAEVGVCLAGARNLLEAVAHSEDTPLAEDAVHLGVGHAILELVVWEDSRIRDRRNLHHLGPGTDCRSHNPDFSGHSMDLSAERLLEEGRSS